MGKRFTVLIADFLDETSIESAVLDDIARIVMARREDEAELAEYLPEADAIMLFHDISIVGEPSFSRAPRCRCVVRAGVGYQQRRCRGGDAARRDRLQRARLRHRGSRRPRDHVSAGDRAPAGAIARGDPGGHLGLRDGRGAPRLRGKTFGVVGCGRIGTAAALRAKALGLDVVFYDPYLRQGMDKALGIRRVSQLEDLLEQSHYVSLHCYLDATSRHMINARTIARMRPGAVLINTARGPLVDELPCSTRSTRARSPPRASTSSNASRSKMSGCAGIPTSCSRRTPHFTASRATTSCAPRPPRKSGGSCWENRRETR